MDKKIIFMLTLALLLIATSLKAWEEPLPHLPTEFECKNYENEGYTFFDNWIWKRYEVPMHRVCKRSKINLDKNLSINLYCNKPEKIFFKNIPLYYENPYEEIPNNQLNPFLVSIRDNTCSISLEGEKEIEGYELVSSNARISCTLKTSRVISENQISVVQIQELLVDRYTGTAKITTDIARMKWIDRYSFNTKMQTSFFDTECKKAEKKF